jgi:hypothetical protein
VEIMKSIGKNRARKEGAAQVVAAAEKCEIA